MGEHARAEQAFRAGLVAEAAHVPLHLALAGVLERNGRGEEAEHAYRDALRYDAACTAASVALGRLLCARGRFDEALLVTGAQIRAAAPAHAALAAHATALKAAGRLDEALSTNRRAADLNPRSAVAHHNTASTLADLARFEEAEVSAKAALALGGKAAQTWLVLGRSLMGQGRLPEAEAALRGAVGADPLYLDAQRDLAQLIWMSREDVHAATEVLDEALRSSGGHIGLVGLKAELLRTAGCKAQAHAILMDAIRLAPEAAGLHMQAAHMAGLVDRRAEAVDHAETAARLSQGAPDTLPILCEAYLAIGDTGRALAVTERMLAQRPFDQGALAYQATAWRLSGDRRYAEAYDYDRLVWTDTLDTPAGWPSLAAYLGDLGSALQRLHVYKTHPFGQSVRHGSQASDLQRSRDPAVQAFFAAVDGPIRRRLATLGSGRDAVSVRNTSGYRFEGVWSVRLRPGGFHADHVHPLGWLSSACYIALPEPNAAAEERAGWIKFGQPGVTTHPALAAEHHVRPEPGMVVLFPSYMWHGTVPFRDEGQRLSIAFDLVPEPS